LPHKGTLSDATLWCHTRTLGGCHTRTLCGCHTRTLAASHICVYGKQKQHVFGLRFGGFRAGLFILRASRSLRDTSWAPKRATKTFFATPGPPWAPAGGSS